MRLLLQLVLRNRKAVVLGILALACVDGLEVVGPRIVQYAINELTRGSATSNKLLVCGAGIAMLALAMSLFRFIWRYLLGRASQRIERNVRQDLYNHLQTLPPQYYDRQKVGDITAHSTNDTRAVQRATGFGTLAAMDAVLLGTLAIGNMLYTDAHLTLITLLPLPLLTLIVLRFGKIVHRLFDRVQSAFSSLTEKAQETISGVRVIKAYGDEESEQLAFEERAAACAEANIRVARVWAVFDPLIVALAFTSMALLLWGGGGKVIKGPLNLGEFVAFSAYLGMLIWPMIAIGVVVNLLQRGAASMGRIRKILDTESALKSGTLDESPSPSIECRDLSFTYPETVDEVLANVSFTLAENTTLGIVGRTGSGKTTVAELLMRLYDPPAGTVFLGGHDALAVKLADVRGMFGYVPQEPFLFAASIAENISFGNAAMSPDEIQDLGRLVRIHDEILTFPNGYETEVGERGVTLSGGQKQRIAIARALAVSPRILVLDDALSSVDAETEAAILENLGTAMRGRTNIIIAHRISAVRNADTIIVLNRGRIEDRGSHAELIQREGYYSELYRLQTLEAESSYSASS